MCSQAIIIAKQKKENGIELIIFKDSIFIIKIQYIFSKINHLEII